MTLVVISLILVKAHFLLLSLEMNIVYGPLSLRGEKVGLVSIVLDGFECLTIPITPSPI